MLPKLRNWPEHPLFATSASTKGEAKQAKTAEAGGKVKLGKLPEWNLADLYPGPESPKLKADLETSERAADAMQERYAGKLAALLDGGKGGAHLAQAVREFEALNEVLGRIVSYAGLLYAATPRTPSGEVLRRHPGEDHRDLASCCSSRWSSTGSTTRCSRRRWPSPSSAITGPGSRSAQGEALPARGQLEQLFHEKSVTARGAWNRLSTRR